MKNATTREHGMGWVDSQEEARRSDCSASISTTFPNVLMPLSVGRTILTMISFVEGKTLTVIFFRLGSLGRPLLDMIRSLKLHDVVHHGLTEPVHVRPCAVADAVLG